MEAAAYRARAASPTALLIAGSYTLLGALLVATRLVELDRGYASDELMTLVNFVREGPREILVGPYIPNNHELFSLFAWATAEVAGESAVALRLWSAIPFLVGVALVTTWVHRRVGALSGILFLFLATASPLLLDITRQARGYGLAFLAMAVVVTGALEATRTGDTKALAAVFVAGVVGTWTLPNFGVAFVATALVLVVQRDLRRRATYGVVASLAAIGAWYSPHLAELLESSGQDYAQPIETAWLLTAPVDQILIPALRGIDETLVEPDVFSLLVVVALVVVLGSSPLLRRRIDALLLLGGVAATVIVVWAAGMHVAPRFLSFLLVPLLMLLASGTASVLSRYVTTGRPIARTLIALTILALVGVISAEQTAKILRLPREATQEVAAFLRSEADPSSPIVAYVPYPKDLERYLGRSVRSPSTRVGALAVCRSDGALALVTQPWILPELQFPCARRPGTRHRRFQQYGRGGHMDVWLIPPSGQASTTT